MSSAEGWALFASLFVVALALWAALWHLIKWGLSKIEAIFTTKLKGKK
jgi:hypothetical protein